MVTRLSPNDPNPTISPETEIAQENFLDVASSRGSVLRQRNRPRPAAWSRPSSRVVSTDNVSPQISGWDVIVSTDLGQPSVSLATKSERFQLGIRRRPWDTLTRQRKAWSAAYLGSLARSNSQLHRLTTRSINATRLVPIPFQYWGRSYANELWEHAFDTS